MKSQVSHPLSEQIPSRTVILLVSIGCGAAVLVGGLVIQWLVYNDWLHRQGPLRVAGSLLGAVLTSILAFRLQSDIRERRLEMLHRFETIAAMNDRIRNALQVIECATYATNPLATAPVREAVDRIEAVLEEALIAARPGLRAEAEDDTAEAEAEAHPS